MLDDTPENEDTHTHTYCLPLQFIFIFISSWGKMTHQRVTVSPHVMALSLSLLYICPLFSDTRSRAADCCVGGETALTGLFSAQTNETTWSVWDVTMATT